MQEDEDEDEDYDEGMEEDMVVYDGPSEGAEVVRSGTNSGVSSPAV